MKSTRRIEIWFFIGTLLFVYGVLIFGAGVYHTINPLPEHIALRELHSDLWWGAVLLVLGLVYCIKFWPGRGSGTSEHAESL